MFVIEYRCGNEGGHRFVAQTSDGAWAFWTMVLGQAERWPAMTFQVSIWSGAYLDPRMGERMGPLEGGTALRINPSYPAPRRDYADARIEVVGPPQATATVTFP